MYKKIISDEKGSVSVYLMIISVALIVICLLFIDFARIAVGKIQIEKAVQLSANAALSYYDSELAGTYGFFCLNTKNEKSKDTLYKYLEKNLGSSVNTLGLKYILDIQNINLEEQCGLNNYNTFKTEMIKAVKYKAPGNWIKKIKESLSINKLNELETASVESRNARERKRELSRQLSELKIKLKDSFGDEKKILQEQIEKITLEIGDDKKSYSVPKISSIQSIESILIGGISDTLGFSKEIVTLGGSEDDIKKEEETSFNDLESWPPEMFSRIKKIIEGIENATAHGAEKLYLVEYISDRMSNLTNEKGDREYQKGEMEYIISSDYKVSEIGAVSNSLFKIWLLRFALNFVSDFSKSLIPEPFERFFFNLSKASMEASTDLVTLINGGSISLFPGIIENIKIDYTENLKLLMYCCDEEQLIKRTYALVNGTNIKFRGSALSKYSNLIKIKYKIGIKLLFIPFLHLDILSNKLKNGCYYCVDEVYYGY